MNYLIYGFCLSVVVSFLGLFVAGDAHEYMNGGR